MDPSKTFIFRLKLKKIAIWIYIVLPASEFEHIFMFFDHRGCFFCETIFQILCGFPPIGDLNSFIIYFLSVCECGCIV